MRPEFACNLPRPNAVSPGRIPRLGASKLAVPTGGLRLLLAIALGLGLVGELGAASPQPGAMTKLRWARGADLDLLAAHYKGPQDPGDGNHFIDLWSGGRLQRVAWANGLTNNRALFINAHGTGLPERGGTRFVYYPHASRLQPGQPAPCYTAADLARVVGPAGAAGIHNILISACDTEKAFSAEELRRHFVNVTNITHVVPGRPGYQPMFLEALVNHSSQIRPIYQTASLRACGAAGFALGTTPAAQALEFAPYVAEIFQPGRPGPVRMQFAGRELLEPVASASSEVD